MFDVVLYQPCIPQNTGSVIRLCANTGARLHLIEPLGFVWDDRRLRRAGLDYEQWTQVVRYPHLGAAQARLPGRWLMFSTRARRIYSDFSFRAGDVLVFGNEPAGLPDRVLESVPSGQRLRLPMADGRSLNLANSVAVAVYEAWRQNDFQQGRGSPGR